MVFGIDAECNRLERSMRPCFDSAGNAVCSFSVCPSDVLIASVGSPIHVLLMSWCVSVSVYESFQWWQPLHLSLCNVPTIVFNRKLLVH